MNIPLDHEIDLYAVLKVDKSCSYDEVQRAYKNLSRNFHPDKRNESGEKNSAEDSFVVIKKAHDILSDPVFRLAYDHGGLLAVELLRRSQVQASQNEDDEEHDNESQTRIHQKEEGSYYDQLQRIKNDLEAFKFVQGLVEKYKIEKSIMQKSPIGVDGELHHSYDEKNGFQGGLGGSLHISGQRSLTKQIDVSVSGQTRIENTPRRQLAGRTTSASLSYRPDNQSLCYMEYAMNQTNRDLSQINYQTYRRFTNGTELTVGLVGGIKQDLSNWVYSLTTKRVILLGSLQSMMGQEFKHREHLRPNQNPASRKVDLQDAIKLLMTWSFGSSLKGQLQTIAATVRNLSFPQWKLRIALLDSPFLKLSIATQEEDSWHGAISWDFSRWRIKIMKDYSSDSGWTLRYGIKYDNGATMGRSWSLLFHLQSPDQWHLRVPIVITQHSFDWVWPLKSMIMLLLGQKLHEELLEWWSVVSSEHLRATAQTPGVRQLWESNSHNLIKSRTCFDEMMSRVAAKKRNYETKCKGLVVIKAICFLGSGSNGCSNDCRDEDVTDMLQFWVVDSHLHLPAQQRRWWWSHPLDIAADQRRLWAWNWGDLRRSRYDSDASRPLSASDDENAGSLYVRYQMQDSVFEIRFQGDELLWLPNSRATLIGVAGRVE